MFTTVFIKKENGFYTGVCLELDIVHTHEYIETLKTEMVDLVFAAMDFAFENGNLDNLISNAPSEFYNEFVRLRDSGKYKKDVIRRRYSRLYPICQFVEFWFYYEED